MASIDFTHATELGISIAAAPLVHPLLHSCCPAAACNYVELAFGETREALPDRSGYGATA